MRIKIDCFSGLILSLFIFTLWSVNVAAADAPRITKDVLKGMIDNPDIAIIDVRTAKDWQASQSKIKGAVREDANDFKARIFLCVKGASKVKTKPVRFSKIIPPSIWN